METAHCGEVRGESFAVACFKLLNEELYVGCDHFLSGLRLGGIFVRCSLRALITSSDHSERIVT